MSESVTYPRTFRGLGDGDAITSKISIASNQSMRIAAY